MCSRPGCRHRAATDPAMLPATTTPPPLGHLAVLVRSGSRDAGTLAAVTTARVAGARVIAVRGANRGAYPAAIAALSAARPQCSLYRRGSAAWPGIADCRREYRGAAARRRPDPVPRRACGGPVRSPGCSGARRPGPAGAAGQHRAGQACCCGIPGPEPRPGHTRLRDHRHRGAGASGPGRRLHPQPVHRAWPPCAPGYAARPPPGCTSSWTCSPAGVSLLAQARRYQPLLQLPDVGLALDREWKLAPGRVRRIRSAA